MKGIKTVVGLFILLVLIGAFFGHHDTSTPGTTTSQHKNTQIAYTRDNVNFISKERVDENIKLGVAKLGDYKEVQVPLSTVVVGVYAPEDQTTSTQQAQPSTNRQAQQENTQTTSEHQPGWTVQTYSTGFGKVQLDIPYILSPDPSMSRGNDLSLGLHDS